MPYLLESYRRVSEERDEAVDRARRIEQTSEYDKSRADNALERERALRAVVAAIILSQPSKSIYADADSAAFADQPGVELVSMEDPLTGRTVFRVRIAGVIVT